MAEGRGLTLEESVLPAEGAREIRQISKAVIACFLCSGAVSLVYEVLWIRMLGLVFGHTVFAVTTVLASFMGGLGLGSFLFGKVADRSKHLPALYGLLEIGIGVYCLALPALLGWAARLYLAISQAHALSYVTFSAVQFFLMALLLVPPTCLMGATLPVLARFFVREDISLGRQIGFLYSINTLGAVLGALLAGYWLVPVLGIRTTLQLAVVMNLGMGSLLLVFDHHLSRLAKTPAIAPRPETPGHVAEKPLPALSRDVWIAAAGFALSGVASMIYEVTWTRALTLIIGSSTYAFTAMLVAFLCGIAGGSWVFAALAGRRAASAATFGAVQLGIGICALALLPVFGQMPVWFLRVFQFSQAPWFIQLIQFGASFTVMLLPTLLIGATFPCAVRVVSRGLDRVGFDTGWIYALNTVGAILGTTLAGFVGIPLLGIQRTMRFGVWLNLAVGFAALLLAETGSGRLLRKLAIGAAVAGAAACAALPLWDPTLMSSGVAIYGQQYLALLRAGEFRDAAWRPQVVYYRDGIGATISVHRDGAITSLRVNGKTDAGNSGDMHTQLFLGHIPMLLHPNPKRVLIIGLGSGTTAGAVAQYPVDRIDIIEIEPAVAEAARLFDAENRRVLLDPRVRIIPADGRNFLLSASTRYDVIISEPSNPWIRGLATLFTREFFALAKSRLAPDGIMVQWLQSYGIAPEDLRMVVRTFRTAFPQSSLWTSSAGDNMLVGPSGPLPISLGRIEDRFQVLPPLREDFARVGLHSPVGFLADHLLGPGDLARYGGEGPLNTDDTLALEFSAPQSLYKERNAALNYRILQSYRSADLPPLSPEDRARVDTAAGHEAMGRAFLGKGLPVEAEAEFARAVRLDPQSVPSRLELAQLLIQRNLSLRATDLLAQVLKEDSRNARAHALLGMAYQQQEMPEQALGSFEQAVALAPDVEDFHIRLGGFLRSRGDLNRARSEYEAALRLRPLGEEVSFLLAETYLAQGNPQGARRVVQPLLAVPSRRSVATRAKIEQLLGAASIQTKQFGEAIEALNTATRLNPLDAGAWMDLSRAYEGKGDLERATESVERLLSIFPEHLPALQRLHMLLTRLEAGS